MEGPTFFLKVSQHNKYNDVQYVEEKKRTANCLSVTDVVTSDDAWCIKNPSKPLLQQVLTLAPDSVLADNGLLLGPKAKNYVDKNPFIAEQVIITFSIVHPKDNVPVQTCYLLFKLKTSDTFGNFGTACPNQVADKLCLLQELQDKLGLKVEPKWLTDMGSFVVYKSYNRVFDTMFYIHNQVYSLHLRTYHVAKMLAHLNVPKLMFSKLRKSVVLQFSEESSPFSEVLMLTHKCLIKAKEQLSQTIHTIHLEVLLRTRCDSLNKHVPAIKEMNTKPFAVYRNDEESK